MATITPGAADVARALDEAEPVRDIPMDGVHGISGDAPPSGPEDPEDAARTARLIKAAVHPLTDYGNGLRLLDHYGDDIIFVPRLGWFRWNGKKWEADEDAFLVRCDAQQVAAHILEELPHIAHEEWATAAVESAALTAKERRTLRKMRDKKQDMTPEEIERLRTVEEIESFAVDARKYISKRTSDHRSHARQSGNSGRISNMILEAGARRRVGIDDLNADPYAVNCANGILRLVEGPDPHDAAWGSGPLTWHAVLAPHAREAMASKMMRADYNPEAPRPNFENFLISILPDPDLREFVKRWFGYTLTGLTVEQKLAFLYGVGRNGKSTLVDVIAKIVDDYGSTVPIETLTGSEQRKGSEATPDLVRLPGARMVRASEPERGQKMKEALVKALTGGEPVMIRRMHQEFVEVVPEFKLTISGNHKPEIRGGDDGIWRRVLLVPFETQVPLEEVDPMLPQKLWEERDGIFAWMVEGALSYLTDGLKIPSVISAATEEYRKDSEPMRVFLLEECEITGNGDDFTLSRDLADAFNAWLIASGTTAWNKRQVSLKLKAYSESLRGEDGGRFAYAKRSDTGYLGIRMPQTTVDRIEAHRLEMGRK